MNRHRWTPTRYFQMIALIVLAAWTIAPLVYMISTSFRTEKDVDLNPGHWIPTPFTLENYGKVFHDPQNPILRWFFNSAVAVGGGTLLTLIVASLAAYGFSRLHWPGRDGLFYVILASTLIPGVVLIIPVFAEFARAGKINTYWPLILVYPAGAFGVFLLRQFYLGIPRELEEAAVIDGAGKFRRWLLIILPLTRTPLLTLTILTFVGIYNDFLWPYVVAQDVNMRTVTVGVAVVAQGGYVNTYGPIMAFATAAAIPTVLLFTFLQRYFVASSALSGIKG